MKSGLLPCQRCLFVGWITANRKKKGCKKASELLKNDFFFVEYSVLKRIFFPRLRFLFVKEKEIPDILFNLRVLI